MSKMSDQIKSKLICITGKPGNGKTHFANYLKENGYKVFIMDEWVHQFYKIGNKGYELIKKEFGFQYVNEIEVDRKKLANLIFNDTDAKTKLDNLIFKEIYDLICNLKILDKTIFVELGIYAINPAFFKNLFKFIIAIDSQRFLEKNPYISKFYENIKFSTKAVENSKNSGKYSIVYVDYIVENLGDLENFEKNIKNLLKEIHDKI